MSRFSADRTRFIPANSVKVCDKKSDAVAYIYTTSRGCPAAIVYFGKQSKAVGHHSYKGEAERSKNVASYFSSRQASDRQKAAYKAKRLAPNALQVGDILTTCWGYDQTNREAYEVTEVSGQYVTIRQIGMASEERLSMQGVCVPQSGQFIGAAMRKRVQYGDQVSICSYITAQKWNTGEVAGVKVGPALSWSSYA